MASKQVWSKNEPIDEFFNHLNIVSTIEHFIVVKFSQVCVLRILALQIVEEFLELIEVSLYLILLENFLTSFRLNCNYEFIVIVFNLIFEFDTKFDVWVVKTPGGAWAFIGIIVWSSSNEREASLLVNLEFDSGYSRCLEVSLLVSERLIVHLEARHSNHSQEHHIRKELSPILNC